MTSGNDVLVTGLPRAGSTLVSALIDGLPGCASLNAPPWQTIAALRMRRSGAFSKWLVGDMLWQRAAMLRGEHVRDIRAEDGKHLLDGMRGAPSELYEFIRPNLKPGFTLANKHAALYSAVLPTLTQFDHFTIIAVIRNPIDVIASWQSLPAALDMPLAGNYWPEAHAILSAQGNETSHMAQLYELYLDRYHQLRDKIHIVKFEDVISDPMIISRLLGKDTRSANAPRIAPPQAMRSTATVANIRQRLRQYGAVTKFYYPDL